MTIQVSNPGVYAQLISAPNPPTAGIPTSTTLFVGRAERGAVETAIQINSYDDFKRHFGAMNSNYPMSYSLNQFYQNGGAAAIIIRLFSPTSPTAHGIGSATLPIATPPVPHAKNVALVETPEMKQAAATVAESADKVDKSHQALKAAHAAHEVAKTAKAAVDADASASKASKDKAQQHVAETADKLEKAKAKLKTDSGVHETNLAAAQTAAPPSVTLMASSPGSWAKTLTVTVDTNGIVNTATAGTATTAAIKTTAQSLGLGDDVVLFNLTAVLKDATGSVINSESHVGVTLAQGGGDRRLDNALKVSSTLLSWTPAVNGSSFSDTKIPTTAAGGTALSSGADDGQSLTAEADYTGAASTAPSGWDVIPPDMLFNMMVIPPDTFGKDVPEGTFAAAAEFCNEHQAFLLIDPPVKWDGKAAEGNIDEISLTTDVGSFGEPEAASSAVFFPSFRAPDPLSRTGRIETYPPAPFMAGLLAQMDSRVGVWAAAAGLWSPVNNVSGVTVALKDPDIGTLYNQGINCIKTFNIGGTVPWGARTMRGSPVLADEYNVIPVRRLGLYIEQWMLENTRWAVFRPNDESTWSEIRAQVGTFLGNIWSQGGLFGTKASDAYFVKCDATTTTQADIMAGRMNVQVGYAAVRPAEFVVVSIQQYYGSAGKSQ